MRQHRQHLYSVASSAEESFAVYAFSDEVAVDALTLAVGGERLSATTDLFSDGAVPTPSQFAAALGNRAVSMEKRERVLYVASRRVPMDQRLRDSLRAFDTGGLVDKQTEVAGQEAQTFEVATAGHGFDNDRAAGKAGFTSSVCVCVRARRVCGWVGGCRFSLVLTQGYLLLPGSIAGEASIKKRREDEDKYKDECSRGGKSSLPYSLRHPPPPLPSTP